MNTNYCDCAQNIGIVHTRIIEHAKGYGLYCGISDGYGGASVQGK